MPTTSCRTPPPPIGAHLSRTKATGFHGAVLDAVQLGADAVQVFACPPRQLTLVYDADTDDLRSTQQLLRTHKVQLFVHTPYTINLCDPSKQALNACVLRQQLDLCSALGGSGLVVHTGTRKVATGQTEQDAHKTYVGTVARALHGFAWRKYTYGHYEGSGRLLIETSAGKGNSIGVSVDDFATLYNAVVSGVQPVHHKHLGVCVDTCHVYESGYDISSPATTYAYTRRLHKRLTGGKAAVKLVHLNDSKKWVGARVDRHEHLGDGGLYGQSYDGLRALQAVYPRVPFVLETHDTPPYTAHYAKELALFRTVYHNTHATTPDPAEPLVQTPKTQQPPTPARRRTQRVSKTNT